MTTLSKNYSNLEELLMHIGNGVLVVHQSTSGSYVMLKNLLTAYSEDRKVMRREALSVFSINELHPLYEELNTCSESHNSTVFIINNSQVSEMLCSPITKNQIINSLQIMEGSNSAN